MESKFHNVILISNFLIVMFFVACGQDTEEFISEDAIVLNADEEIGGIIKVEKVEKNSAALNKIKEQKIAERADQIKDNNFKEILANEKSRVLVEFFEDQILDKVKLVIEDEISAEKVQFKNFVVNSQTPLILSYQIEDSEDFRIFLSKKVNPESCEAAGLIGHELYLFKVGQRKDLSTFNNYFEKFGNPSDNSPILQKFGMDKFEKEAQELRYKILNSCRYGL